MNRLDPNVSFVPAVEVAFGKDNITVVKDAEGGQPIRRWYKNWKSAMGPGSEETGDLYDRLMEKVKTASEGKSFTTVTFIWMQGERDAREQHGEVYAISLKGLKAQLAADLERDDINMVIGRLSDFDLENVKYPHWSMVREAQVRVAESDPRAVWVDTDDLNDGVNQEGEQVVNDLHLSIQGYKLLGKRFADKAIALIQTAQVEGINANQ